MEDVIHYFLIMPRVAITLQENIANDVHIINCEITFSNTTTHSALGPMY